MRYLWARGKTLGSGSNGVVSMAAVFIGEEAYICAVKSSSIQYSFSIQHENLVLTRLGIDCPHIIYRLDHQITVSDNGAQIYNLFLPYMSGGTLSDHLQRSPGGRLSEPDIRRFTNSLLKGLSFVHSKGFVHCDIKPQNILVDVDDLGTTDVKIADFGEAKVVGKKTRPRGTPLYRSPECVTDGEYESGMDIWALGCVVCYMITGKSVWGFPKEAKAEEVLVEIGWGKKQPSIPMELSYEGKDFVRKCLVRDPRKRWTAHMLLNHPFVNPSNPFQIATAEVMQVLTTAHRSYLDVLVGKS